MKPDLDLIKRQIEAQLSDYERAVADYAEFMERWRNVRLPRDEQGRIVACDVETGEVA